VLLQNPQATETPDFTITTTQAIARTREKTDQLFTSKFFYDKRFTNNNTVSSYYVHNEVLQILGNLTEISKKSIHVNVHQAHSLSAINNFTANTLPRHTIHVNINGYIHTPIKDYPQSQNTSFEILTTQW